jgi:hypothetical protein
MSVYPNDDFALGGGNLGLIYRRQRIDGFAGVLAGVRRDRFGAFAKIRPGFTHLNDRGIDCGGDVCAFVLIAPPCTNCTTHNFSTRVGFGLRF